MERIYDSYFTQRYKGDDFANVISYSIIETENGRLINIDVDGDFFELNIYEAKIMIARIKEGITVIEK